MLAINIIGIGILVLFSFVIFTKKQKRITDYVLIWTILLFIVFMASHIWIYFGLNPVNFALQNLSHYYLFPSYVCYSLLITDENHTFRKEWLWIGSFAILFTLFTFIDFFFLTDYDSDSLRALYDNGSPIYHVFYKGGFVFDIIALFWFSRRLKQYRHRVKENYSFIDSVHLNWLHTFTWFLIFANLITLCSFLLYNFGVFKDDAIPFLLAYGAFTLSLFYFCYNGMKQYHLAEFQAYTPIDQNGEEQVSTSSPQSEKRKYQYSSLKDEEMHSIFQRINDLFSNEKIYSNPELKIYDLARQLDVTTHNVSQTINSKAEKTFYDFVNEYRVAHLKELLTNPDMQHYTILGLGMESGFNSKTSLNRIFKQHTGMSPGMFRKTQLHVAKPQLLKNRSQTSG